jgi:hypothetical protein
MLNALYWPRMPTLIFECSDADESHLPAEGFQCRLRPGHRSLRDIGRVFAVPLGLTVGSAIVTDQRRLVDYLLDMAN